MEVYQVYDSLNKTVTLKSTFAADVAEFFILQDTVVPLNVALKITQLDVFTPFVQQERYAAPPPTKRIAIAAPFRLVTLVSYEYPLMAYVTGLLPVSTYAQPRAGLPLPALFFPEALMFSFAVPDTTVKLHVQVTAAPSPFPL